MSKNTPNGTFVLGLMSGTSLDGLDLALCEFAPEGNGFAFKIHRALTVPYNKEWKAKLSGAPGLRAEAYFELHAEFGRFMAAEVLHFLEAASQKPELLCSHGHTVFHQPQKGFSTQLGCGATLAGQTGISTVCDFRSMDVALGGQGAPLVPLGDKLLFSQYQACVNLGGIANISFDNSKGERLAFDICEANMLLNHLSEKAGRPYDDNGSMARSGQIEPGLLSALNELEFYKMQGAKSLGREWFESQVLPIINASPLSVQDLLSTSTEHIAMTVAQILNQFQINEVLFSGGGAFNTFLLEKIQSHTKAKCNVGDNLITNYKEALIFALLGYLRVHHKPNILKSVTGSKENNIGGAVYCV